MSREKFPVLPEGSLENEEEEYNPTPEEIKMALEMSGEKVNRVITGADRKREGKEAKAAFEAARRKILGETEEGQQEMFRE